MKILFAASEALPFAASGGLADVAGSLPAALGKHDDIDCRVVMPLYRSVTPNVRNKMTYLKDITVEVGWRKQYCGIYTIQVGKVTYYLLDNPYYFMRDGMYGFYDDCERFVFFSRAGDPAGSGLEAGHHSLQRLADRNGSGVLPCALPVSSGIRKYPYHLHHSQHSVSGRLRQGSHHRVNGTSHLSYQPAGI